MRFRKIASALVACMAVAAVSASAAQANWTVGGATLGAEAHKNVHVEAMTPFTLQSSVLGAGVKLTASGLECATECTIDGSSFGTNHSTGALKFTGVTVDEPASCSVPGGTLTTNPLTDEVTMRTVSGSTNTFDRFFPETGTTFVVVPLAGAECPLAGVEAPVEGVAFGETEETGKALTNQPVKFNAASNSVSTLTLGGEKATLTGEATNKLSPEEAFSAHE